MSAASTTISSPQLQRYAAIVPSASVDPLPLALNVAPTLAEYGPPGRAIGATLVEGGGGGGGGGGVDVDVGAVISTPATSADRVPILAPGTVPPMPPL